jgi:iron complex outermembrane receptor protein
VNPTDRANPLLRVSGIHPSSLAQLNRLACLALIAQLASFATTPAHAQASSDAGAADATPNGADTQLPDITVTATRQAQPVARTPAAVSIVTGTQVREAGVGLNLSESLGGVPGIAVLNRQNLAQDLQISSRGFGARSTFGVRGVRLYEDGIPLTMPDGQGQSASFDLSQVRRIEVLRGPASALYGNSSGGVISVFTADGTPVPQLSVSRAMSRDATQKTSVSASGQKGALDYVLDVSQASTAGYRDHSSATREQWHAKFGWQLSEATHLSLVGNHMDMPDVADPLGLTQAQWQANPSQAGANALVYNTRKDISQGQMGLVLDHRLSDSDQLRAMTYTGHRSATQWQAILSNLQSPATHPGGVIDLNRQFGGIDLRHSHQGHVLDLPWQLSWGANIDTLREHRQGFQNFDAQGNKGVIGDQRRDEINRATNRDVYVLNQLQLAPAWQASLGWRHSQVAFRSRDQYIVSGNGDDSGRMDFDASTPTASLMWQITPRWQTYVSLGRSFETPTLNEVAYRSTNGAATGWNTALKASTATHREWGSKYSVGPEGGRPIYAIDAALFEVATSNEIAVKDNSGGRSTFQNVGHTHRYGLEMEQQWRPLRDWQFSTAATWTEAHYRNAFGSTQAGFNLPGVPHRVVQAEALWQPAGQPWHTALTWRHMGRIWANDINDAYAPASSLWSVRAAWHTMVANWRLDALARVDNVFDTHTVGSVIVNESQKRYFEPAPGRSATVGVTLSHAFD